MDTGNSLIPSGDLSYYNVINSDPSFDNVIAVIDSLLDKIDSYQWTIGGLLVFLRFKSQYKQIKYIDGNHEAEFSQELMTWASSNKIKLENGHRSDFLHWHRLDFRNYTILYDQQAAMIFEPIGETLTDTEFREYLDMITGRLRNKLDDRTAWAYYITALKFPESVRIPHKSWTYHYNVYNLMALKASSNGDNPSLTNDTEYAIQLLDELENQGISTTTQVRNLIKQQQDLNNGYTWKMPLPDRLLLAIAGTTKAAIVFTRDATDDEKTIFMRSVGLLPMYGYTSEIEIILAGDSLLIGDRVVAHLPLLDQDKDADAAIIRLAAKMRWKIQTK